MSRAARPRVLLADDHIGVLAALQRMLAPSCQVVGRVTAGAALAEAATRLRPDVVVLDLAMQDVNGLDVCWQITHAAPETKVVILTATDDADVRQRAVEVGASAFVLKHLVTDRLLTAIDKAWHTKSPAGG